MYKKTSFKFLRVSFLLIGSILSLKASDVRKGSLFEAMQDFAEGNIEKAAPTFLKYGRTCPMAKPFCEWLEQKGYKVPGEKPIILEDHPQQAEFNKYLEAALKVKELRSFKQQKITKVFKEATDNKNGPLLFVVGQLYEKGTKSLSKNKQNAFECYNGASNYGDVRATLSLHALMPHITSMPLSDGEQLPLKELYSFYIKNKGSQDEGNIFYNFAIALGDERPLLKNYFIRKASYLGHGLSQLEQGKNRSEDRPTALFWLTYAASHNNIEALRLCGHMFKTDFAVPKDLKKALYFFKKSAEHTQAEAKDFHSLALVYLDEENPSQDFGVAEIWHKKSMGASAQPQEFKEEWDKAQYKYAVSILGQQTGQKTPLTQKALAILETLSTTGNSDATLFLFKDAVTGKLDVDIDPLLSRVKSIISSPSASSEKKAQAYLVLSEFSILNPAISLPDILGMDQLSAFKKAFELDPNEYNKFYYAQALHRGGKYEEALQHFQDLESLGTVNLVGVGGYNFIGNCYDALATQELDPNERDTLAQKAYTYFQKQIAATPDKCSDAAFNIYRQLIRDWGVREHATPENILKYLKMAADQGDPEALSDLGVAYKVGLYGLPEDDRLAEEYWRKAIKLGAPPETKLNLAHFLLFSELEPKREESYALLYEIGSEKFTLLEQYLHHLNKILGGDNNQPNISSLAISDEKEGLEIQKEEEKKEEEKIGYQTEAPDLLEESKGLVDSEDVSVQQEMRQLAQEQKQLSLEKKRQKKIERQAYRSKKFRETDFEASKGYESSENSQASSAYESSEDSGTPRKTRRQTHQEQVTKEQAEKTERKLGKLKSSLENLKSKNIEKYRKVKRVMGKHITLLGGQAGTGKGSGRSYSIGGQTKGYHAPHGGAHGAANIKAGSFKGIVETLEEAHESRITSEVSENALPEQKNS